MGDDYSAESINVYIKSFWRLTGLPQMLLKFRENQIDIAIISNNEILYHFRIMGIVIILKHCI